MAFLYHGEDYAIHSCLVGEINVERVITYDLAYADSDDYKDFYDLLKRLNGKMLTESTYVINSSLEQNEIIRLIRNVMKREDNIYYISVDNKTGKIFYNRVIK